MSNTLDVSQKIAKLFGRANRYLVLGRTIIEAPDDVLMELKVKGQEAPGRNADYLLHETVFASETSSKALSLKDLVLKEVSFRLDCIREELAELGIQVDWDKVR